MVKICPVVRLGSSKLPCKHAMYCFCPVDWQIFKAGGVEPPSCPPQILTLNAKEAAQFMKWQNKFTRDRTGEIQLLVKSMK